jgi:hypothetical protein
VGVSVPRKKWCKSIRRVLLQNSVKKMTSRLDDMHIKRMSRELSIKIKEILAVSLLPSKDSNDEEHLMNRNMRAPITIKLPSMSKIRKKSFFDLFNGNLTDEDFDDSRPRRQSSRKLQISEKEYQSAGSDSGLRTPIRRNNSTMKRNLSGKNEIRNRGKDGGDSYELPNRRASDTARMKPYIRNTGKDSGDSDDLLDRRASGTSRKKSHSISANQMGEIPPIRRQRNSMSLFLKNSEKRVNGSRKPSLNEGEKGVEYNDAYVTTVVESVKQLSYYVQNIVGNNCFELPIVGPSSELLPIVEPSRGRNEDSSDKEDSKRLPHNEEGAILPYNEKIPILPSILPYKEEKALLPYNEKESILPSITNNFNLRSKVDKNLSLQKPE